MIQWLLLILSDPTFYNIIMGIPFQYAFGCGIWTIALSFFLAPGYHHSNFFMSLNSLDTSKKWNQTLFVFFFLNFLVTRLNIFMILHVVACIRNSILFKTWIPHFVYSVMCQWTFVLIPCDNYYKLFGIITVIFVFFPSLLSV